MHKILVNLLSLLLASAFCQAVATPSSCKCIPGEPCWPSKSAWQKLNKDVEGKLIKTEPIAEPCYPGTEEDMADCGYIVSQWPVQDFQTSNPIGRVLPYNVTCPPVNYAAAEIPTTCRLGDSPTYAVNATTRSAIKSTLRFAQNRNLRLVVTGTGHDLLGRSDGYGGLEVWLRYYRNSIDFQQTYSSATGCNQAEWKGSAIRIDGNWQWRDVSKVASAHNVIVTTGGSISVGAIGGWPSGGGHGPATQALGFGADQVLEAEVMLADGRIVVANACKNADLYRALRGGGPGYGVVLSTTVKAHQDVEVVTAHHLTITPLTDTESSSAVLDAVAVLLQLYPDLVDAGVGGYTYWYNHYPTAAVGNSTSGYKHGVWTIGQGPDVARAALQPVVDRLRQQFNSSLSVVDEYVTYPDYWTFYQTEMAFYDPQGNTLIMSSRLIDSSQVANFTAVRDVVEIVSNAPGQYNSHCTILSGGGQVPKDGQDPMSGLNPAWRRASYAVVTIRQVPLQTTNQEREAIEQDMLAKGAAMESFAPGTGAYMNEANRRDPNYIENFYGTNYASHLAAKKKYDPANLFYCPTCVGSEAFQQTSSGALCSV